jgi:hypothetical protein
MGWKEIARTYAPSVFEHNRGFKSESYDEIIDEIILFGQVTILWECTDCYELRKEKMLGKLSTQPSQE